MTDATSTWGAARDYARNGIYVNPVYVTRGQDGRKQVKPVGLWRDRSSISLADIAAWEQEHPAAGLLIDCGKSRLVVVDCDGEEGCANWAALDPPAPLWIVNTPSGGEHWYYRADPDHPIGNDQSGKVAPSVDIRGLGGFVFAPPSSDGTGSWAGQQRPDWSGAGYRVPAVVIERMRQPEKPAPSSTSSGDLFDNAGRHFTREAAQRFVNEEGVAKLRARGLELKRTGRKGYNGLINEFAMVCAHFPKWCNREWTARKMLEVLGPITGWTAADQDDLATIESAWSATERGKSWVAVPVLEQAPAREEDLESRADEEPEDRWTDSMLAGRIARGELAGRAIYTAALGWLLWDGKCWDPVEDERLLEIARRWVLAGYAAAVAAYRAMPAPDHKLSEDPAVKGWAGAQSANRIASIIKLARGILIRDASDFDQHPDLLNTPSGVVDLRTGQVGEHDPELLLTKITGAAYVAGAEAAALKAALDAVPEDSRDWLRRRLGEAATGHSGEQMVLLSGVGRNGKTLLMGAAFRALGGYAAKVPNTLLLRTRAAGGATPEKMTLRGVRLAYMEETPEDGYLDATMVKDLLDAEEIEGRHLYKNIVSWMPTHSLFLNTNHPPTMGDTGDAAWRRLTRLDFPFRYRKEGEEIEGPADRRGDPGLKRALGRDREGQEALLAWIVAGAREFYERGPEEEPPASVRAGIQLWREESDDLLRFIAERMMWDPDGWVARSDMYQAFAEWLRAGGQRAPSVKTFGQRMNTHSLISRRLTFSQAPRERVSRPFGLLQEGLMSPLSARVLAYGGLSFQESESSDQG